ncbi:MAG: dTDP-4-dehydrorhamnose reductase [Ignavibacteria bacterium]|nr:dTDP-4-dehydrorhamnose reductase [Ignavibacteria bacterium]
MEKIKVLVTGSNGLLGQNLTKILLRESDFHFINTSIEENSFFDLEEFLERFLLLPEDSQERISYETLDITNKENVKKITQKYSPEFIVNCAAFTNVDECETEKDLCWKLNVDAVKNLIIASRICNAKIIHISTDYIFDGKNGPYTETDTPNPISFYGRSKLASENALKASGVDFIILRTIVLYGSGNNVKPNFALWLVNELSNSRPVRIVKDQIGNTTHAEDLAYGILKVIEKFEGKKNVQQIYNIAGKDILSRLDFAYLVCDIFGYDRELITPILTSELNQPAPRPLKSGLITLKAETELGLKPMTARDGIQLLKFELGL